MLKLDFWNIFFAVVNLLVIYFIFKKTLFQPVLNVIHAREELIKQQLDNAQKTNEDADKLKKEYEEQISTAKEEADKIVLEARERAEQEKNKKLEMTRIEAQNMLEKAKADIEREQEMAKKSAQADIARLAIAAAEKIIKTGDAHDAGSSK